VGKTPLYRIGKIKNINLPFELYLKDDSQNPTFSFKDRASELVSAYAKENGIDTIVAASTGNAGSSLAGICASQNQRAIIFVPASAPLAKLTQMLMYGAQLVPIDGSYDDAFDISIQATEHFGWFNRNTAYNPFTIEGKKTVSYELYRQLNWQAPDRVFVPVGDGVIISGVYKGFYDLLQLGIIDKMPQVIAVQSQGSSNIVDNLDREDFAYEKSDTIADSIAVDIPRNFHMAKKYLKKYNGEGIKVSDEDILTASKILSENTGIFSEPAASAAFAGFLSYFNNGKIEKNTKNVVLLTGSGLKDLNAVQKIITMPPKIKPVFEELQKFYDSFIKNQ
jgi:threonine synthase